MKCARKYFEDLREEALKRQHELEALRHDSEAKIVAWRIEVYESVLQYCVTGLYLEDVGLAVSETLLRNDYNFTYERGRRTTVEQLVQVLMIPAEVTCA